MLVLASALKRECELALNLYRSKRDIGIGPYSGTVTGEDECNKLCSSLSPLILLPPANGSSQHIGEELLMLRGSGLTDTRLPGRTGVVEHQHEQVERQNSPKARHRLSDRLRCIPGGMGCSLLRPENRGPWSCQEHMMHINCLELLAATLATKTFAKSKTAISILLRIDNTTTVAYINNLGGTASKELVLLT